MQTFITDKTPKKQPSIYDALAAKLGRLPTNQECKEEVFRILTEGMIERASKR